MKTLLLLRHAKSSWKQPGLADHDRPLNARGKADAPAIGELIEQHDLVPDAIITSTAKRASKTARKVAAACGFERKIKKSRNLYMAGPAEYIGALRTHGEPHDRVMLVGHNPGIEEFVHQLTDQDEVMPTAALAEIALPIEDWEQLSYATRGELRNLWRPRELDA